MQQFLVKTPREIDYSIAAAFENDYFLFLWHFWAKLVAGVAANRWMECGARFALCTTTVVWLL